MFPHALKRNNLSFPTQQIKYGKRENAIIVEDLSKKKIMTVSIMIFIALTLKMRVPAVAKRVI